MSIPELAMVILLIAALLFVVAPQLVLGKAGVIAKTWGVMAPASTRAVKALVATHHQALIPNPNWQPSCFALLTWR